MGMTELWDAKRCAAFLGYSYDYFRKEIRHKGGVPQPVQGLGRDRWLSDDWIEWARKFSATSAKEEVSL